MNDKTKTPFKLGRIALRFPFLITLCIATVTVDFVWSCPHPGVSNSSATNESTSQTSRPPNVIIFYTDDQGSIDANCYGAHDLVTPTIDGLATTGVRFTQMYSPSAICSASRAGLMSGRYPVRAGVPDNVGGNAGTEGMPHSEVTIADMLHDAGYKTAHIGKWHLGHRDETKPNGQGFDYSFGHMQGCIDNYSHFFYWNGANRHDLWLNGKEVHRGGEFFGDLMQEHCEQFITENQEQPFFVYMAINWPHYPLQGTKKWRDYYSERIQNPQRRRYAALMSSTDELMGKIVAHLESLNLRENTLIIFQSDHGHSTEVRAFGGGGNAGPYRGHKGTLFEGGIQIPSVVSLPGVIPAGETRDQAVFGCDWLPTIADYAGVKTVPLELDGKNIRSVIDSNSKSPHEYLYWLLGRGGGAQWAVRRGDWKLMGNAQGVPSKPQESKSRGLFLVNLAKDISETTDLSDQNPETLAELTAIHERIMSDVQNR